MATLQGPGKLAAVTKILNDLSRDLDDGHLSTQQRDSALEELKVYGRDPRNAEPIFAKDGIATLTKHAFDSTSSTASKGALRCLCNALLLNPDARKNFVSVGYEEKACERLKSDSVEDEFLVSRIIFLTTYGTEVDLNVLVEKYDLAKSVIKNLERHVKQRVAAVGAAEPMAEMALQETLKLVFNITHFCKEQASSFMMAIPPLVTLLCKGGFHSSKPLDPPIGGIINALLNLPLGAEDIQPAVYPPEEPNLVSDRLIELLSHSSKTLSNEDLENSATPLIGVIRAIHEYSPGEVKVSIRTKLLPDDSDRSEVLGQSQSLPSWLIKNTTNPLTPLLREGISDLLFDMSDKDPTTFVNNVGFGFASGYLYNRNLPVPSNPSGGGDSSADRPVNPVTGQFLDSERQPDGPEMTEEEREREAERLFVLFERLRANGVISVENPIRTAVESGRFEELPDDIREEDVD